MTRVLVVDDSALMRKYLRTMLEAKGFDVATARNGADALAQIDRVDPDVVTLDVNMPEMDGLTCLGHIMASRPRPVVMVSSLTDRGALVTLEAMELGAVDYVAKPGGTVSLNLDEVAGELVTKVRAASRANVRSGVRASRRHPVRAAVRSHGTTTATRTRIPQLLLIGASTGGPAALPQVLGELPADFPVPVVVAQHIPPTFSAHLAQRLDSLCAVTVREVTGTALLEPGTVYLGQGNADVVVSMRPSGLVVRRVPTDPNRPWHPSVDRLVESAREAIPDQRLACVLLTGMGDDGAAAMTEVRRGGGHTVAESERSAVVWGMPGELARRDGADEVLDLDAIGRHLCGLV